MWESLNVGSDENSGAPGQNTGFYWLDQWKLYTSFSVDETAFVHVKGNETINGQKTIDTHLIVPVTINSDKIDTSFDYERTHYATIAQVTESTLLLSGSTNGAAQSANGSANFNDTINFYDDVHVGHYETPTVLTMEGGVTTTVDGTITFNNVVTVNNAAAFNITVAFNNDVEFVRGLTIPVKDYPVEEGATTEPTSEHQVVLATNTATTALNTHKNAAVIDHPIPMGPVTSVKIANGTIIYNEPKN